MFQKTALKHNPICIKWLSNLLLKEGSPIFFWYVPGIVWVCEGFHRKWRKLVLNAYRRAHSKKRQRCCTYHHWLICVLPGTKWTCTIWRLLTINMLELRSKSNQTNHLVDYSYIVSWNLLQSNHSRFLTKNLLPCKLSFFRSRKIEGDFARRVKPCVLRCIISHE